MPVTIGVTILQDKRDGLYVVVNDDGVTVGNGYATLQDADNAARAWAAEQSRSRRSERSRIPQKTIDKLLLSDDPIDRPYSRLLASEVWPAFETWLDSEAKDTPEKIAAIINALSRFAAVIISGFAHEHWEDDPQAREVIQRMAATNLRQMMKEPR